MQDVDGDSGGTSETRTGRMDILYFSLGDSVVGEGQEHRRGVMGVV